MDIIAGRRVILHGICIPFASTGGALLDLWRSPACQPMQTHSNPNLRPKQHPQPMPQTTSPGKPVIITGAPEIRSLQSQWSPQSIIEACGEVAAPVSS